MYIVIELQTNTDGTVGTLVSAYEDQNQAESKYHQVLEYAAVSNLPKHACCMISEEGFPIHDQCYKHTPQPEPEPEPNEGE